MLPVVRLSLRRRPSLDDRPTLAGKDPGAEDRGILGPATPRDTQDKLPVTLHEIWFQSEIKANKHILFLQKSRH